MIVEKELNARGVILHVTAPDTPAQNGPAEQAGALVVEAARAMMQQAKIPHDLWLYAVKTAVMIINLLPTTGNEGHMSPHERLSQFLSSNNPKPYIKHLRTYGCTAYVHKKGVLRPARAAKMQTRALKGKLVGYDSLHGHIYWVWVPSLNKVLRVRDVRFYEGPQTEDDDSILYDAVMEETVDIPVTMPAPTPLVPSTQREEHEKVLESVQKKAQNQEPVGGSLVTPESTPEPTERPGQPAQLTTIEEEVSSDFDLPQYATEAPGQSPEPLVPMEAPEPPKTTDQPVEAPGQLTTAPEPPQTTTTQPPGAPGQPPEASAQSPEPAEPSTAPPQPGGQNRPKKRKAMVPPVTDRTTRGASKPDYRQLHRGYVADSGSGEPVYFALAAVTIQSYLSPPAVPKNLKQARESPEYETGWLPAMRRQHQSIVDKDVWELVEPPKGVYVLPGQWVYTLKTDANGDPLYRACWVVCSNHQKGEWT